RGLDRYMYGSVAYRARELGLKRRREIPRPRTLKDPTVDNSGQHRPVVSELEARVEAIIARMPTRVRQVYLLYHADGFDGRTIATALGLTITTVNRHHARALQMIARDLAESEWADTLAKILESR